MPSLKEALSGRITTFQEFVNALVSVNSRNAARWNPMLHTDVGQEYPLPHMSYLYDQGAAYNITESNPIASLIGTPSGFLLPKMNDHGSMTTNSVPTARWWIYREYLRTITGVYDLPDPLVQMFRTHYALAPHVKPEVSKEDPSAVFYTPDIQAGERDSQVRTTLGKLVRKLYPWLPDTVGRDMDAALRAEMSDDLDFVEGPDITKSYIDQFGTGTQSCIAKPWTQWSLLDTKGNQVHPADVYNAPGWRMAVVKIDGKVRARSLVWENPDDANDKRFIRCYGDVAVLERRLKRRGYAHHGAAGALLRRIPLAPRESRKHPDTIAMAYIDCTAPDRKFHGTRLLWHSEEFVKIATREEFESMSNIGISLASGQDGQHSHGSAIVSRTHTLDALNFTCPVLKKVVRAEGREVNAMIDGQVVRVSGDGANSLKLGGWVKRYYLTADERSDVALFPGDTPTVYQGGDYYVDSERFRTWAGYVKLDATLYPSSQDEWFRSPAFNQDGPIMDARVPVEGVGFVTGAGRRQAYIRREDAVHVVVLVESRPTAVLTHAAHAIQRDGSGGIGPLPRVQRIAADIPMHVMPDVTVVRTLGGKSVVLGVHPVTQLADGVVEYTHRLVRKRAPVTNRPVYFLKGSLAEPDPLALFAADFWEEFDRNVNAMTPATLRADEEIGDDGTATDAGWFVARRALRHALGANAVQTGEARFGVHFSSAALSGVGRTHTLTGRIETIGTARYGLFSDLARQTAEVVASGQLTWDQVEDHGNDHWGPVPSVKFVRGVFELMATAVAKYRFVHDHGLSQEQLDEAARTAQEALDAELARQLNLDGPAITNAAFAAAA